MRTKLMMPPWCEPHITEELKEAVDIIADDVWKEASIRFYAERDSKMHAGKTAPKGLQRYLNEILDKKFKKSGWSGDAGYFFKGHTWVRITFRHQMSLGSDFIDAIKVCKKEGMELAVILAADKETLKLVSPNDASALVSYEKLQSEIMNLDGAIDIPLMIGCLTPLTRASVDVDTELRKDRPRDTTLPNY